MNNADYWTTDMFYKRLDFYLNQKGWSYNRLSCESEIGISMLYEMRRKHYLPRLKNLCSICDALDVSLSEFFDVEESYNVENIASKMEGLSLTQLHTLRLLVDVLNNPS